MSSDIEKREEDVLKSFRNELSLDPKGEDALFARVNAAALSGVLPRFEELPETSSSSDELGSAIHEGSGAELQGADLSVGDGASEMASKWRWLTIGGAGGAMLGFVAGVTLSQPSPQVHLPRATQQMEVSPNLEAKEELVVPPTPQSPPVEQEAAAPSEPKALEARSSKRTSALDDSKEEAPAASFYEEMSYLRRAQAALRDGQPQLALGLMRSLDEMKTQGALLVERRVTKVLALCALSRTAEARKIAASVLSAHPGSVYESRLKDSCAVTNSTK